MNVSFADREARVPATEQNVEMVLNHARSWIHQTNEDYATELRHIAHEEDERQRRELRARIRQAEESKAAKERVRERLSRLQQ